MLNRDIHIIYDFIVIRKRIYYLVAEPFGIEI